jgi:TDG/mug DNA glycosylase family protein
VTHIHSFAPISGPTAQLLILGSMPGRASLAAGEYYAHPRNAFWQILAGVYRFNQDTPYRERCELLIHHGVALWDVLKTCTRASSLDSDIVESSIVANDLPAFLQRHPEVAGIFFNGAKAEQVFARHILPLLSDQHRDIPRVRLPSTSPANASVSLEEKRSAWSVLANTTLQGAL